MSKEIAETVGGKRIAWLIALIAAFAVFATVGSQWRQADATSATDETVTATYGSTDSVIPIDQMIDTLQTSSVTGQSSPFVTNVTNKDPRNAGVLSYAGGDSILASAVVSSPHGAKNPSVAVSTASGVEYAPYAIVRVLTSVDNNLRAAQSRATFTDSSQTSSYVSGLVSAVNPWKTTASTTGAWAAILDSSQGFRASRSSSFVTDTNNKVPGSDGVLSYAGVNSSLAASVVPLPLPWEKDSVAAVSTASGVEYAPYAIVRLAVWLLAAFGLGAIAFGVSGVAVAIRSR